VSGKRRTLVGLCGAAALFCAAGRTALAQQLAAAAAAAGTEAPAGTAPAPAATSNETVLITLAVVGVVLVAGLLTRALLRAGMVGSYVWMLPVLAVVSGAFWWAVVAYAPPGLLQLRAMARFLFLFLAFLCLLLVVARAAMPSQVLRTRAAVPPVIRKLAVLVCAMLGFFVLLGWSFPDINFTPVFVTSGALSIVIGLAVQDLLANVLAGVVISTERPFKVGDWVRTGELEGEVSDISWRVTRLHTRENDLVEIPNRVMLGERLMNFDKPTPVHVRRILVGVTYETPPALAVNALIEAASRVPSALKSPAPVVQFKDYADSSLVYELRVYIDNYASALTIDSDVRKEVWYSFKRHGITIPFPQRDVHMYPVPAEPVATRARLVAAAGLPEGFVFELVDERTTIGRDPANRLCIANQHVSAQHAVIEREGDRFVLRDLGSRLGTMVNGQKVQSAGLRQGDLIEIGPVALVLEAEQTLQGQQSHRWMHKASSSPHTADPSARVGPGGEETKDISR
jgi:small-conductance mechanosensitive channel